MERALQELSSLGNEHQRITAEQRESLNTLRTSSLALIRRGAPVDAVAHAVGLSSAAVTSWLPRTA